MLRRVSGLALIVGMTALQAHAQSATPATPASQAGSAPAAANPSSTSAPDTAKIDASQPDAKKKPSKDVKTGVKTGEPMETHTLHAQRKAAKLYLEGVKLLEKQQPEPAWNLLKQAVALVPDNATYAKAAELARQSAVTQLVQESSRERDRGGSAEAVKLLQQAQALDPTNPLVLEHLGQLAADVAKTKVGLTANAAMGAQAGISEGQDTLADGPIQLQPKHEKHSFHLRSNTRQACRMSFARTALRHPFTTACKQGRCVWISMMRPSRRQRERWPCSRKPSMKRLIRIV